jgi:hypothetical protein
VTTLRTYTCGCILQQDRTGLIFVDRCDPCAARHSRDIAARTRNTRYGHAGAILDLRA